MIGPRLWSGSLSYDVYQFVSYTQPQVLPGRMQCSNFSSIKAWMQVHWHGWYIYRVDHVRLLVYTYDTNILRQNATHFGIESLSGSRYRPVWTRIWIMLMCLINAHSWFWALAHVGCVVWSINFDVTLGTLALHVIDCEAAIGSLCQDQAKTKQKKDKYFARELLGRK